LAFRLRKAEKALEKLTCQVADGDMSEGDVRKEIQRIAEVIVKERLINQESCRTLFSVLSFHTRMPDTGSDGIVIISEAVHRTCHPHSWTPSPWNSYAQLSRELTIFNR
jgi:hypothetical protein